MDTDAMLVLLAQAASVAWLAVFGVGATLQMIRAVVHDRRYSAGWFDFANAAAVLVLLLLGFPAKL